MPYTTKVNPAQNRTKLIPYTKMNPTRSGIHHAQFTPNDTKGKNGNRRERREQRREQYEKTVRQNKNYIVTM